MYPFNVDTTDDVFGWVEHMFALARAYHRGDQPDIDTSQLLGFAVHTFHPLRTVDGHVREFSRNPKGMAPTATAPVPELTRIITPGVELYTVPLSTAYSGRTLLVLDGRPVVALHWEETGEPDIFRVSPIAADGNVTGLPAFPDGTTEAHPECVVLSAVTGSIHHAHTFIERPGHIVGHDDEHPVDLSTATVREVHHFPCRVGTVTVTMATTGEGDDMLQHIWACLDGVLILIHGGLPVHGGKAPEDWPFGERTGY